MNPTTLRYKARDLAGRLIAREAAALNLPLQDTTAVFRVSEKLRGPVSTLAGSVGFRTLLSRALQLAKTHSPGSSGIGAVQVSPDGSLEGLSPSPDGSEAVEGGGLVVVAHLLELLVLFVGESLVLQLVQDAWPDLPIVDPEMRKESQHDATR